VKTTCGWRFVQTSGKHGLGDAIVLGPHLRKSQLSLDRRLVEQWVKGAPGKSSILARKIVRRLPKLLVVLEEWVAPTWTHVYTDPSDVEPGPCAVGLNPTPFPEWKFVAIPGEATLTAPMRIGNGVR
jgi:hypothetical protein